MPFVQSHDDRATLLQGILKRTGRGALDDAAMGLGLDPAMNRH
jgi:hypothetical protein